MNNIETSRKSDKIVEARASMIELASVKREMTSPVRRVAKKGHRKFKDVANIGENHINT